MLSFSFCLMQNSFKFAQKRPPVRQGQQCVRICKPFKLFQPRPEILERCLQSVILISKLPNDIAIQFVQKYVPQNATQRLCEYNER